MEILFVSHKFPPTTGGMEKQSYELISGMERKCTVHRLVYEKQEWKPLFFIRMHKRIKKICRENPRISIIHFNDGLIASWFSFFKFEKNIRYVVTLHGLDVVFPSSIYHRQIFPRLNKYDSIIAVSQATAAKTIELGIDKAKVVAISNGVDTKSEKRYSTTQFHQWLSQKGVGNPHKINLLLLGRAVSRKGFSWFATQVMPLLGCDFQLLMVGPFRFVPSFQERLIYLLPKTFRQKLMLFLGYASDERAIRIALRESNNIFHFGKLPHEEVVMIQQNADAFLMPNIHIDGDMEGFGLVCLEAVAQGQIVFAANTDGIPDAIQDQKNGFLLPSGNAKIWAETLRKYSLNKENYTREKEDFINFTIQNYKWEKMVVEYYSLFEKLNVNN